jgi:hypothetical protein
MTTQIAADKLAASNFSKDGYLGTDSRTPQQIIKDDLNDMAVNGIIKKDLVIRLRYAYVMAERALGNPLTIAGTVRVVYHDARGRIPSPIPEDGTFQKGEVELTDTKTGVTMHITPLSIHLIDKYDFFQGIGSPYRIDPVQAALLLRQEIDRL